MKKNTKNFRFLHVDFSHEKYIFLISPNIYFFEVKNA